MKAFFRKLIPVYPVMIIMFGLMPLPLMLCLTSQPEAITAVFLGGILTLLLTGLAASMNGRRRIIIGIAGTSILFFCSLHLMHWQNRPSLLLIPFLYSAELFTLIRPSVTESNFRLPFFIGCSILYGSIQLGMSPLMKIQLPWSELTPFFQISFILFLLSSLLLNNQDILETEVRFGRAVPGTVLNVNRLNILVLITLSTLAACIPQIAEWIRFIYRSLKDMIGKIINFLSMLFAQELPPDGPAGAVDSSGFMMEEALPEQPGNPLFERIASIVTGIILAALGLYLLYRMAKLLFRIFRKIVRRFQQYMASFDHTYEDTYEDLPDEPLTGTTLLRKRRSHQHLKAGSPRELVRWTYQQRLRHHPEWLPGETVRSHLSPSAAHIYEKARYSPHPVTEQDASSFTDLVNRE
ncbi:MAG: DUF4129 domain-containing protein [Clostridia bacterium]|nr:DUF4129 domain-containing protein [Clostridia bacterium]